MMPLNVTSVDTVFCIRRGGLMIVNLSSMRQSDRLACVYLWILLILNIWARTPKNIKETKP